MKLRDFILTEKELPPANVYVLGYWEGEPAPFVVIRRDEHGLWLSSEPAYGDDYIAPTSWSHLPGGIALNRAGFHGKFEVDLDAEV